MCDQCVVCVAPEGAGLALQVSSTLKTGRGREKIEAGSFRQLKRLTVFYLQPTDTDRQMVRHRVGSPPPPFACCPWGVIGNILLK